MDALACGGRRTRGRSASSTPFLTIEGQGGREVPERPRGPVNAGHDGHQGTGRTGRRDRRRTQEVVEASTVIWGGLPSCARARWHQVTLSTVSTAVAARAQDRDRGYSGL